MPKVKRSLVICNEDGVYKLRLELLNNLKSKLHRIIERAYMRPEVNSNRPEILFRGKISLWCEVTSLSALTWLRAQWTSPQCKFNFGRIDRSEISNRNSSKKLLKNRNISCSALFHMKAKVCLFIFPCPWLSLKAFFCF